jgi:hypothetical protein
MRHRVIFPVALWAMRASSVPAICDHSGKAIGRACAWPQHGPDRDGKPDRTVLQVARSFGRMNFAARPTLAPARSATIAGETRG